MIKRLRSYFKSTFVRYIVSYLALMALLVGGLTVYMYSYYRSSVYDSTISAETSLAWQQKYRADSFLDRLDMFSSSVGALPTSRLSRELSRFTNEDGEEVYVYSGGSIYDANGSVNAEQWVGGFDYEDLTLSELRDELFEPEELTIIRAQNVIRKEGAERLLTISIPADNGMSVICMLPEGRLLDVHSDAASESNRYIIYRSAICARSEAFSLSENKVLEAGMFVTEAMSEVKRLQGVDYLFTAVPGMQSDLVYVSVQPLTGIRAKAAGVWLGFMAVLLAFAIPCTLFMVYISRKNLAPILEMGRHFKHRDDKYSDTISTIVSGIEELEGKNREISTDSLSARRHIYARNLVTGAFEGREQAVQEGRELALDIDKSSFAVILIGAPKERRQDDYLDSLLSLAPENVCCIGTDLVESSQSMILCFADDPERIAAYAKKLSVERMILALHLPVAMSALHSEIRELSLAYLEATSAYESRFFMGENRLLRFSEIPMAAGKKISLSEDHAKDIRNALVEGDIAMVDKCLERLRNTISSENMNLFSFRQVYNDVIGAILSQAEDQQYTNADIYDLFSLSGCRSVDELEQVLRNVCEGIIASKNVDDKQTIMQRVISIMTVNYTDSEFTLSRAAELAGITPVRLTNEFKTKMGMTPMDYLTMLRMEEAKKLLKQTELPIGDVCRQAGYSDASSFTRRFKQYVGTTPLQYRQNAVSESAESAANDAGVRDA